MQTPIPHPQSYTPHPTYQSHTPNPISQTLSQPQPHTPNPIPHLPIPHHNPHPNPTAIIPYPTSEPQSHIHFPTTHPTRRWVTAAQGSFPVPGLHSLLPLQIPLPLPPWYRRAQHRSRRAAVPSRCRSVGGAVRGGPDCGAAPAEGRAGRLRAGCQRPLPRAAPQPMGAGGAAADRLRGRGRDWAARQPMRGRGGEGAAPDQ